MTAMFRVPCLRRAFGAALLLLTAGCMEYGPTAEEDFSAVGARGLFVVNEGNFNGGNASLTYYDPATCEAAQEVFRRANGMLLGDTAQSMTVHEGTGWIVVNNSGAIYAIDLETFRVKGSIEGLTSPRYIHFLSDDKAYVTQLWDRRICIVDPRTFRITGYIDTPQQSGKESTEQMVRIGRYVYTNCWSYNNRILVIDTETDTVCDTIEVGVQPTSLVVDRHGMLWTATDGGYEGNPAGHEAAAIYRIDPERRTAERMWEFPGGRRCSELQTDGTGDALYFIMEDIWRVPVDAQRFPVRPLIEAQGTLYYGLTVDPVTSEIYVADAIDYQQQGVVRRYSADGVAVDEFRAGIIPGAFCWKPS